MTLGSIIARLNDEALLQEALAGLDDLVLLAQVRSAADDAHQSVGSLVSAMVGHFVQYANDDQWLALMTVANRADNPAAGALRRILLQVLPHERVRHLNNGQR